MSAVLMFVVTLIVGVKQLECDCGKLWTVTPEIVEGETLKLRFIPQPYKFPRILYLERATESRERVEIFNRELEDRLQRADESKLDAVYVYTIGLISKAQAGRYFMMCKEDRSYSNGLSISVLQATQSDNNDCGNLTVISKRNTVGTLVQLFFRASHKTDYVKWLHWKGDEYLRVDKNKRDKYEETKNGDSLMYVLKIYKCSSSDAGFYKVQCGKEMFTNGVNVHIVMTPPGAPMFTNLEDFPHCNQCIKAYQDTDVEVTCKSDGGSPPVNFSISSIKDGVRMELFSEQSLIEEVSYKLQVTEEFAWAKISCDVRNDASKVPLSTSAIVYLLKKPSHPVFGDLNIKEGQDSEVTCSTKGGRPQPEIKFKYNNTIERFTNTAKFNEIRKTFSVSSSFKRPFYRWDNHNSLQCCVMHDLFRGKQSCDSVSVDVQFPPALASFEEDRRSEHPNGSTRLSLKCDSGVSNPVSNITFTGLGNIEADLMEPEVEEEDFGGFKISQVVTLVTGKENLGKKIGCTVTNSVFPNSSLNRIFTINVTYPPYVTIKNGSHIKATNGQDVKIICMVDSNPISVVYWWSEEKKNLTQVMSNINESALYIQAARHEDSGRYFCRAKNRRGASTRNISLIINDSAIHETETRHNGHYLTKTAAITGAIVVGLMLVLGLIIFARKHRIQKNTDKHKIIVQQCSEAESRLRNLESDNVYNNIEDVGNDPVEYSSVIPKELRRNAYKTTFHVKVTTNETEQNLVYADLDLESSSTANPTKRPDSEVIEYVTIDFKN